MRPFVTRQKSKPRKKPSQNDDDDYEVSLLVIAKRVGLTFSELNLMTLQELFDFVDIWMGDGGDDSPQEATQADIDAFFRM